MNLFRSILVIFVLFCSSLSQLAIGQDSIQSKPHYTKIGASYLFGGQMYNDTFIYNSGYKLSVSHSVEFSKHLILGAGAAYMPFINERFIPFYVDLVSNKKDKKNTGFFNVQLGYSHAWNNETSTLQNYEFKGGVYLSAGSGKKIAVNNKISLLIWWSYNHQFATLKYSLPGGTPYSKTLNYDLFSLSTAFQF